MIAGPFTYLWGIKAELSEAVIVIYGWKGGRMHTVAGISTGRGGEGGSFKFYNTNNKEIDGKEMSIWTFIKKLKDDDCKPLYFYTYNRQVTKLKINMKIRNLKSVNNFFKD